MQFCVIPFVHETHICKPDCNSCLGVQPNYHLSSVCTLVGSVYRSGGSFVFINVLTERIIHHMDLGPIWQKVQHLVKGIYLGESVVVN